MSHVAFMIAFCTVGILKWKVLFLLWWCNVRGEFNKLCEIGCDLVWNWQGKLRWIEFLKVEFVGNF